MVATLILSATALASALFVLRQQRLELMHQVAKLHTQIRHTRQDLWERQVRIAAHAKLPQLQQSIKQAQLELESWVPVDADQQPFLLVAGEVPHDEQP